MAARYDLNLDCTGDWPSMDVRPTGRLDLDLRPLPADDLRRCRERSIRGHKRYGKQGHYTQEEFAQLLGLDPRHYRSLESGGEITNGWAPLVRLLIDEFRACPDTTADASTVRYISDLLGGHRQTAREVGVAHKTVLNWACYGAPKRHGYGYLLKAVAEDLR